MQVLHTTHTPADSSPAIGLLVGFGEVTGKRFGRVKGKFTTLRCTPDSFLARE